MLQLHLDFYMRPFESLVTSEVVGVAVVEVEEEMVAVLVGAADGEEMT